MFSSKNHKLYIFLGGILFSLFFSFSFLVFSYQVSAQGITLPSVASLPDRSLPDLLVSIINGFLGLLGVIALGIFVYGGIVWMTSGGDAKRIALAKKILISAATGFFIILISWGIVQFIFNGANGGPGGPGVGGPPPPPPLPGVSCMSWKFVDPKDGEINVPLCASIQAEASDNLESEAGISTGAGGDLEVRQFCTNDSQCPGGLGGACAADGFCQNHLPGFVQVKGRSLAFYPSQLLTENATYLVALTSGIANASASQSACNKIFQFTTGTDVDTIPPKVLQVSPKDNNIDVCLAKSVKVQFSEPMDLISMQDVQTADTAAADNANPICQEGKTGIKGAVCANDSDCYFACDPDGLFCQGGINKGKTCAVVSEQADCPASVAACHSDNLAGLEINPLSTQDNANDLSFASTVLASDRVSYAPIKLYKENTTYNPILRADILKDRCGNSLDGELVPDGTAEGTTTDDYFSGTDALPDQPNPVWSFRTGTDPQCTPVIDSVVPISGYYDEIGADNSDEIVITGNNFDDIAASVYFNENAVASTGGIQGCYDKAIPAYSKTTDACVNPATDWSDKLIKTRIPGGGGSSNGAIDGGVYISVDNFDCTGVPTVCVGGTRSGESCNAIINNNGPIDPDFSTQGCPGGVSNVVNLDVLSPHISSHSPNKGPKGQWITLNGADFGAAIGTVRFIRRSDSTIINGNFPCAASWIDTRIIVELPIDAAFNVNDILDIQIIRPDGRHSNLGAFTVTNDPLGPGICALSESCGESGTLFNITGKRFGAAQGASNVIFKSVAETTADYTGVGFSWGDEVINNVKSPAGLADGSYNVLVRVPALLDSNSLPFDKPCAGRPRVVNSDAACSPFNFQSSPNPRPDSADNCSNLGGVVVKFTTAMDDTTLTNANIKVNKCVGYQTDCTVDIPANNIFIFNDPDNLSNEGFIFFPNIGDPNWSVPDSWYQANISANVASETGLKMGTAPANNYIWDFHITASVAPCAVDGINAVPDNWTMNVGATKNYIANTFNSANAKCNLLDPPLTGWSWMSVNPAIANATNIGTNQSTVSGVSAGNTTINTALSVDGNNYTDSSVANITNVLSCADANLTAVWKFDEDSGSVALDSGSSGTNDGTLISNPTHLSSGCKFGKCLEFDGVNDYVRIPNNASVENITEGSFTIEAWVKPDSVPNGGAVCGADFSLCSYGVVIRPGYHLGLRYHRNQKFIATIWYSDDTFFELSSSVLPPGAWHHLLMTVNDAAKTFSFYVDGAPVTGSPRTYTKTLRDYGATNFNIGTATSAGIYKYYMDGSIDEVRLWNKAMDVSEVQSIYNQACMNVKDISCSDPNLKAVWKLDENSGIAANDSTANHNDGQLNNNPTWESADCKYGKCLKFDGVDDYIKMPDSDSISMTNAITMEAWIKTNENTQRYIFSKHNDSGAPEDYEYTLLLNGGGIIRAEFRKGPLVGDYISAVGTSNAADGNWHHIAATFDGNDIKIYNNGILESTTPWVNNISSTVAKYFFIGQLGYGTKYFNGSIDEPRIWNKALTQEEIISAMSQECKAGATGQTLQCTNDVVGAWNLNEGNGTLAADWSRNRNDGTVSGGAAWHTTGCQFGKCLEFDGTDTDYVLANPMANFPTNEITTSFWMKSSGDENGGIVSYATNTLGQQFNDLLIMHSGGAIQVYRGSVYKDTGVTVNDNNWHHIAVSWRGSDGELKTYKDGILADTSTLIKAGENSINQGGSLVVGQDQDSVGGNFDSNQAYKGFIDEVRIYNRILSDTEILNTYQKSMTQCVAGPLVCSDPNLAAVWKFDEDSGSVALDSGSSGANDGTLTNNPTRLSTGCKFGKCLSFDGVDDYVKLPNDFLGAPSAITIEGWFNTTTTEHSMLFSIEDQYSMYISRNDRTDGSLLPFFDHDSTPDPAWGVYNDGKWHYFAAVNDGVKTSLYVDGAFINSRSENIGNIGAGSFSSAIGALNDGSANYYKGLLDEVRIWNKALEESEIKSIYNQACMNVKDISCSDPNLKAVWKLDENSGIAANDSTSNNNDGQLNNNPSWENADCKYGKCLKFDGVDDYISTPAINVGSKFTVDFWMKPLLPLPGPGGYGEPLSAGTTDRWLSFLTYDDGHVNYNIGDGINWGNELSSPIGIVNDNQWHHIAGTYNGNQTELFIDGVSFGVKNNGGYLMNQPFKIGWRPVVNYWFKGSIDEPRIWDKALTQEEVISAMSQECKVGGASATLQCTNDVAGLWSFDDGAGSVAADGSKNRNDGELKNGLDAGWNATACQFGKCLSFDGTDDYIEIPNGAGLNYQDSNAFTVQSWIKWNGPNGAITRQYIWDSGHAAEPGYLIFLDYGANKGIRASDQGPAFTKDLPLPPIGVWTNVAGVFDKINSKIKIYIDGNLQDSVNWNPQANVSTSPSKIIGDYSAMLANPDYNFNGTIDELRVYDHVLSDAEILANYQKSMNACQAAPLVCSDPNLAGVWKFDEAAGDAAVDSTDNNNQGVLQNSPTRLSTGCKFGKCLEFDGTNEEVRIKAPNIDPISKNFTVETWFYIPEAHNNSNNEPFISKAVYTDATHNSGFIFGPFSAAGGNQFMTFSLFNDGNIVVVKTPERIDEIAPFPGWHHAVGAYDGNTAKLYIDGNLKGQQNYPFGIKTNTTDILIGQHPYDGGQHYKGRLDEVRFWNKALEESEIKSIYNQACMPIDKISCSDPNLKAVWKFDENSGIVANDSTANNNDGQLKFSPTWKSGVDCKPGYGSCLSFDGNNNYIEAPDNPIFNFGDGVNDRPFTFEAWIKRSTTDSTDVIFSKYYTQGGINNQSQYWFKANKDDGKLNIVLVSGGGVGDIRIGVETQDPLLNNTDWHHVAATYDGNKIVGGLKLYVDGIAAPTDPIIVNGPYAAMKPTIANFQIGRYTDSVGGGGNFNGLIDEPRIWDKALTQEEIISAMSQECKAGGAGATLQCTNDVVGIWNFDEGNGTLAADGSRNKNNGVLIKNPGWSTNACQFGGCLNFDGANNYVEIADNSSLDVSNEATVMLWANIENIDSAADGDDVLLDKMTSDPEGPFGILLFSANTPAYGLEGRFGLSDSTVIRLDPGFVPPTNQWHHYAITFKSGEQKMYYDSKEVASDNKIGKLIQNNLPIHIGKGVKRAYNTDAVIDEVRIYNRALSAAEITNTYQKSMTQCVEATLYCSDPELTAVWKMDEGIGVVAGDSTANNLDGTLKNGLNNTGWKSGVDCKFTDGKCLQFDGVNNSTDGDYIHVSDSPALDFGTGPFTIEGWVKTPASGVDNGGTIVTNQTSGGGTGFVIHTQQNIGNTNYGRLYFRVNADITDENPEVNRAIYSPSIDDDQWHHFAAVREGTAIRMYIDGNRAGQDVGGASFNEVNGSFPVNVNTNYRLSIGVYRNGIGGEIPWTPSFKGSLDELRIWKKALTDDQIKAIWNNNDGQQCLAPQKGSACDLDLTAPSCQPNVGLCEGGDPNLRCSIKSCTCQQRFIVDPTPPNPSFAADSSGATACRNTAITVNFNEPIDASTIKTATTNVVAKASPLLSESFTGADSSPIGLAGWTETKTSGADALIWQRSDGKLFNIGDMAGGWFISPNPLASTTNFRISFDAGSIADGNNAIGIAWNYIDENNYYRLVWEDPTDSYASLMPSRLVLQKRVNGPLVENPGVRKSEGVQGMSGIGGGLAEKDNFIAPVGQSAHFYIDVVGTTITVSNDSGALLTYNDSSAPAILPGKIAFFTLDNDGGIFYDNLVVTEYEATNIPGTVELYALQSATGNILADGDMERADTDVWKAYATPKVLEKSTAQKKNGSRSLHIITDAPFAGTIGEGTMRSFMANTGDAIRVRGWVKVTKGVFVAALKDDQSGWSVQTPNITSNAWTEFTLDYSTPSTGDTFLWLSTPGAPDSEFYVDDISVTVEHNLAVDISTAVNGSQLTISPRQLLDPSRNYNLILKGTNDAYVYGEVIKSIDGTPLEQPGDYVWNGLTTGTEICKIGKAEIQFTKGPIASPITYKGFDSFTCAGNACADDMHGIGGNQHSIEAKTYSTNGGPLGGVMTYNWTKSVDAPFDIVNVPMEITAGSNNGTGTLYLDVNGGDAGTAKTSANVTIALCENPWLGGQASVPWTENTTNFSLWYCRDAGNMQDITDDLPNLTVQEVTNSPGSPKPIKEYFYYDANSVNDAIGIRVYANPSRLPLTEWLDQNANVSGGQSGMFNGWQSVRAGRSLYVSAMNDVVSGIYNNIYLISYSDKSSSTLIGIYNQMISNWKFMVNGVPDADIAKLQRDIRRIDDLGKIATALDNYKTINGSYPKLDAGTYLPGMSTSVWPSWQASFGNALQTSIPKDPINQMSNLVGYWKFDEGTGIAANDSSVKGNNGRLMNNPVWKSGADCKVGGCLELNASDSDDYVIINPISDFPTTEITTAYWTKTSDSSDGVISYAVPAMDNDWLIYDSDNLSPHRSGGIATTVSVKDNAWHFVAVTWKSSNGELKVYKDGILASTKTLSAGTTITHSGSLIIGQEQDCVGGCFEAHQVHTGLIDEVQIYNRALSGSEIALLAGGGFSEATGWNQDTNSFRCDAGTDFDSHIYHYQYKSSTDFDLYAALEYVGPNTGNTWRQTTMAAPFNACTNPSNCACYNYKVEILQCSDPQLSGAWKFDEASGNAAIDSSANNNDGTLSNSPTRLSSDCKFGSCLNFDKTNDYIDIPGSYNSAQGSIELWVKPKDSSQTGKYIVMFGNGYGSNFDKVAVGIDGGNNYYFGFYGMGGSCAGWRIISSTVKAVNVYAHITGTWDGSGIKLYINGNYIGNDTNCTAGITNTPTAITIGDNTYGSNFDGQIDEVRLWNKALIQGEIVSAMKQSCVE